MKIFQLILIHTKQLGVISSFNLNVVVSFSFLVYYTIFTCAFFLFKAETMAEFIESFYVSVTTIAYLSYFVIVLWNKSKILKFIENFENLIGKRKLNLLKLINGTPMYNDNNLNIFIQVVNVHIQSKFISEWMKRMKNGRNSCILYCWDWLSLEL